MHRTDTICLVLTSFDMYLEHHFTFSKDFIENVTLLD